MIKSLRVLLLFAALISLAVILATVQTTRTGATVNDTYTVNSTDAYLDSQPWFFPKADLDPLAGPLTNSAEY